MAAGFGDPQELEHRRRDVADAPAALQGDVAVGVVHVQERHGVRRVRGVGLAGRRVLHQLAVAVVRRDEERPALGARRLDHLPQRQVDRLHRRHRGVHHSGVADHVGVREVHEDEVELVALDRADHRVADGGRAHLRLLVVGRDVLGRRDHRALFPGERLLAAAVEEVGHVRVLLRLRAAKLREPGARDDLREDVGVERLGERDGEREALVVGGHAGVAAGERGGLLSREAVEGVERESARQLAGAVGAEVEVEGGVLADVDARVPLDDEGLHELVGLLRRVRRLDPGERALRLRRVGMDDRLVGLLHAVPPVVAVHRPVAPGHDADRALPASRSSSAARDTSSPSPAARRGRRGRRGRRPSRRKQRRDRSARRRG